MASQTPNIFLRPREEPGTQGHLDLVEPLQALPRQVAEAIAGLSRDDLRFRADEDGWCIQEIVGHLRDACEVYHKRIYMMSTQTDPILQPYDPDVYAKEHGYLDRPLEAMLADIKLFRTQTVALLTSLVNWNWARTGQHLEDGRISIRQIVEHMIEHEAEHLSDIRSLRAAAIAAG